MSPSTHVPADDDAASVLDLVEDCREVSGVLAPYLPGSVVLPLARPAHPVEIDPALASSFADAWGDDAP